MPRRICLLLIMKPLSGMQSALLLFPCLTGAVSTQPWTLNVPSAPLPGARTVDPALISYSIEFANFLDYAGNVSTPNTLSRRMLGNLAAITGSYPEIRLGGTTANHATFVASQKEPMLLNFTVPGADQPTSLTWGPSWLDTFGNLQPEIQYTIGLSFNSGDEGTAQTVAEAVEVFSKLNSSLYALEIGNEFDGFPVDRNTSTWTVQEYIREWLALTDTLRDKGIGNTGPFYQAGAFLDPGSSFFNPNWTFRTIADGGILDTGMVKSYSGHQYFGVAGVEPAPTLNNILNNTIMSRFMDFYADQSSYAAERGIEFNIGETNSISRQGQANVSDVFGSALWSVNYSLWAASLNVSRIYYHSGVGYRYAAWQPRRNGTTAAGPRPLYYGHLLVAEAVRGGDKQIRLLHREPALTAYGIYRRARGARPAQLAHVVVVNMQQYDGTGERPSKWARLALASESVASRGRRSIRRLSAPSVTAKENITWAGKTVDIDGVIHGDEVSSELQADMFEVPASEAVMVSFH